MQETLNLAHNFNCVAFSRVLACFVWQMHHPCIVLYTATAGAVRRRLSLGRPLGGSSVAPTFSVPSPDWNFELLESRIVATTCWPSCHFACKLLLCAWCYRRLDRVLFFFFCAQTKMSWRSLLSPQQSLLCHMQRLVIWDLFPLSVQPMLLCRLYPQTRDLCFRRSG